MEGPYLNKNMKGKVVSLDSAPYQGAKERVHGESEPYQGCKSKDAGSVPFQGWERKGGGS